MYKKLQNQEGISLIKLIVIIVVIIVGIIFIVKMSEPQDGILSVEDAEKQYQNTLREKEKAEQEYQQALNNVVESTDRLEELEKGN